MTAEPSVELAITALSCITDNTPKCDDNLPQTTSNGPKVLRIEASLDALARICVFGVKSQVVATSLAVQDGSVVLFISANTTEALPDSLKHYLTSIWVSLKQISQSSKAISVTGSPPLQQSAINDLGANVYKHCARKVFQTINKRLPQFEIFSEFLRERNRRDPEKALPPSFEEVEQVIGCWNRLQAQESPSDEDWKSIAKLTFLARLLLGPKLSDDEWMRSAVLEFQNGETLKADNALGSEREKSEKNTLFDCRRYVREIFAYQGHIENVVLLGCSRHCSYIFEQSNFSVQLIRPSPPFILGPIPDEKFVSRLLHDAYETIMKDPPTPDVEAAINTLVERVMSGYEAAMSQVPPHAECTLLNHHRAHPIPAPFSYMGVSKLACYGCSLYFDAYNSMEPLVPMRLKGSHGQVAPWQFPGDDPRIRAKMLVAIYDRLALHICDALKGRTDSQSATASGGAGISCVDVDVEAEFLATVQELVKRS